MALKNISANITGAQAANSTISAASPTITMSGTKPATVSAGDMVYDTTKAAILGFVATWVTTTLTLTANSLVAGTGATDLLVFTKPLVAVQWNSAMAVADRAALNALITTPVVNQGPHIGTNMPIVSRKQLPTLAQGVLYQPYRQCSTRLFEGDWIVVDPVTGDIFPLYSQTITVAGTSWIHT